MTLVQFTRNYSDHSNSHGFQFEFFCDKCHNGYRSQFVTNKLGMAESLLRAAGDLFGGPFNSAAAAGAHMKDAARGKAWDSAYMAAIEEARPHFRQCRRCGMWVCPEVCWNADRAQCKQCSPDLHEEAASIQVHAAVEQLHEKARKTDLVADFDFQQQHVGACPHCNARVQGTKFCPECGKPLASQPTCGRCGTAFSAASRFCPECGAPRN